MSFIYEDTNLIDQLLQSGLEHAIKFTKKGQSAVAAVQQDRANLLGLIRNLQDQLNPAGAHRDPNAGPLISYEGDTKPTIDSRTLESLGDLVKWLDANKVTVNNQRVVYGPTENPNDQNYVFYRLQTHMADPTQRNQQSDGFYVNLPLLKSYVVQLQA